MRLGNELSEHRAEVLGLLQQTIALASMSGNEGDCTRTVEQWVRERGFQTDLWETDEADLAAWSPPAADHIPLSGRPTLVVRLPGRGGGRSLILNAHSDVVPAGEAGTWRFPPWLGALSDGCVYGRGACDAKGPLAGALWAMLALRRRFPQGLAGDLLLELVPGEEDCVGLGTLTSIARGYRPDAAVVLEPTDNVPRCASRSGVRFEITCRGLAVHGTAKWLGKDAIRMMRDVLDALDRMEKSWNVPPAGPLFVGCPIARPITVDSIAGGQWQGMVCERCSCSGYIELLPDDETEHWKGRFAEELKGAVPGASLEVRFGEQYAGHSTPVDHPLCGVAEMVMEEGSSEQRGGPAWRGWSAFNSGCEAGLRADRQQTPTLVWGPGSLSQAHAPDEHIRFRDVETFAGLLAHLAVRWSQLPRA
jgi:acetylornithine deacetylase